MPDSTGAGPLAPTPAQTIGPFFGHALPHPGGGRIAPEGHPGTVTVHGRVRDGAGAPVPDALLEFWQAGPDGGPTGAPGSLRRDRATGDALGRGAVFTGFGRVPTDADGRYAVHTLLPSAPAGSPDAAPYLAVCVHARGLLHHLFTRIYFPEHTAAHAADPLLAGLPEERARTLLARPDGPRRYRFDVRLQQPADGSAEETVFLAFG
ncbi:MULTISPECIES: protocatechuate 3,4-dioxygenase subunit alpha [unclassified Streptomyces]|uniref:protocatechuate 3,4-dioxygenase subunit alpha n=1 Tax=unclassified Streptomyces TaxID=2593676 RepID=UPI00035DBBDF|nr:MULTISPECIES: protocatechuate 3,4-dioxygenase subunit alpha [unclassified Streptomyces]MYT28032.1 protocatechuate 3,4-dioxygenase subunit alpha [Streptomyces sp. SID8354]